MTPKFEMTRNDKTASSFVLIPTILQMLSGLVLAMLGSSTLIIYRHYQEFHDGLLYLVPNFLLAVGGLLFVIQFTGCYAAINRKTFLTVSCFLASFIPYALLMNFVIRNHHYYVESTDLLEVEQNLRQSIFLYGNNTRDTQAWDNLQEEFYCCGIKRPSEWVALTDDGQVPKSCCPDRDSLPNVSYAFCKIVPQYKYNLPSYVLHDVYSQGCLHTFLDALKDYRITITGIVVGVLICQTLSILTMLIWIIKGTIAKSRRKNKNSGSQIFNRVGDRSSWIYERNATTFASVPYVVVPGKAYMDGHNLS